MASLACSEADVGPDNHFVLDCDGGSDSHVGPHAFIEELGRRKGYVAGVEEGVEAVLAEGMAFDADRCDGLVEVDLAKQTIGSPETEVSETSGLCDAVEVRAAKRGL